MKIWCAFSSAVVFIVILFVFVWPMPAPTPAPADAAISLEPESAPPQPTARQRLAAKLELAGRFASRLEQDFNPFPSKVTEAGPPKPKQDLSLLAYYAYSEVPPDEKPAETV